MRTAQLIVAALLLAWPVNSGAKVWGEYSGWIVADSDTFCFMRMEFEGEGETELNVSQNIDGRVLLIAANYNWSSVEDQAYEITYRLNGSEYTGGAKGKSMAAKKGFVSTFPSEFLTDLAKCSKLEIYKGDQLVDELMLIGSGAAVASMGRCVAHVKAERAAEARDKARLSHIPRDPFAADPK